MGLHQILVLSAPLKPVTIWDLQRGNPFLGLVHKTAHIPAEKINIHIGSQETGLAFYHGRSLDNLDVGQRPQGNLKKIAGARGLG